MIGAGIFVLPGPASSQAGPAVAVAFVIGGVIALFTAISASELGTAMPKAGGSYYFINHALGPIFGTVAGWGNWMGLAFASAFYCLGFGDYINTWLGLQSISVGFTTLSASQMCGLGAAAFFIAVNYIGAKETGRLQNIIVLTLLLILSVFVAGGVPEVDVAKLQPLIPEGKGYLDVIQVTALVFVSFLGFAKITTVAEEIQDPGRNLPIAIIGSVVIVTVIYAIVMLLINGIIPWHEIGEGDNIVIVNIADILFGPVGVIAMTFGGLLATASSANASILASSRINFAMGRDRLVSPALNEIHSKYSTPHRAIALTGFLIVLFIVVGDVKTLAKAGSVLHLIVYGLLNISLLVMREKGSAAYDPDFVSPLYPFIPIAGAILSFGLIAFMAPVEILLSAVFVIISVGWYFFYARGQDTKPGVLFESTSSSAAEPEKPSEPEEDRFRVIVPLANPEHQKDLITLASAIAKQKGGEVIAVHIVEVPDQTPLAVGAANIGQIDAQAQALLDNARRDAETLGVDIRSETVVSHETFEQIFEVTRRMEADLAILGWGDDPHGSPGRVESALGELTENLPCDFLVFKDRGFDPSRILLPTAGGPDSDVSAAIAKLLAEEYDSSISLLHVVESEEDIPEGEAFLDEWAKDRDLDQYDDKIVEAGVSIEDSVEKHAEEQSLLILGATEQGLLTRLTRGTSTLRIIDGVDISVLLVEKARDRTMLERLFGS